MLSHRIADLSRVIEQRLRRRRKRSRSSVISRPCFRHGVVQHAVVLSTYLPFTFYASILFINDVLLRWMKVPNAQYAASKMRLCVQSGRRKRSLPTDMTCFKMLCNGVGISLGRLVSSLEGVLCPSLLPSKTMTLERRSCLEY